MLIRRKPTITFRPYDTVIHAQYGICRVDAVVHSVSGSTLFILDGSNTRQIARAGAVAKCEKPVTTRLIKRSKIAIP